MRPNKYCSIPIASSSFCMYWCSFDAGRWPTFMSILHLKRIGDLYYGSDMSLIMVTIIEILDATIKIQAILWDLLVLDGYMVWRRLSRAGFLNVVRSRSAMFCHSRRWSAASFWASHFRQSCCFLLNFMKEGFELINSLLSDVIRLQSRWVRAWSDWYKPLWDSGCSDPGAVSVTIVEGCYLQMRTVGRAV